jgi:hypothetical protein
MLSPFAVILIPQSREKDLRSSLRVNSAKHPCSLSPDASRRKQLQRSFARPKARRAQDDRRLQFRNRG